MLTYDPAKRIAAADALADEWIATAPESTPEALKIAQRSLKNLQMFKVGRGRADR
jgi:hypothetical protein